MADVLAAAAVSDIVTADAKNTAGAISAIAMIDPVAADFTLFGAEVNVKVFLLCLSAAFPRISLGRPGGAKGSTGSE